MHKFTFEISNSMKIAFLRFLITALLVGASVHAAETYAIIGKNAESTEIRRKVIIPSAGILQLDYMFYYTFGKDGELTKLRSEYLISNGYDAQTEELRPTRCVRTFLVSEEGELELKSESITDMGTKKVVQRTFPEPVVEHWMKLADVPPGVTEITDPWGDFEKAKEVKFDEDPVSGESKLIIKLLEPMPIHGHGSGGSEAEWAEGITLWTVDVGDHGFIFTSEGDLYCDHLYVGNFDATDDVRFSSGRFWKNAKPCVGIPLTGKQKELVYREPFFKGEADGSDQVEREPWKIFIKPVSGGGGGIGYHLRKQGMTVLRFENEILHLQGIPYGKVSKGDEIRILEGVVFINGVLRAPSPMSSE